jgi:disulfide bond formation protein DsbB
VWHYLYAAAISCAVVGLVWNNAQKPLEMVAIACFIATSSIAAYHLGVEQGLIDAPESCAAASFKGVSLEELKAAILSAPKVSCKDVGASFVGISMAGWNVIYGLAAAFITGYLWKQKKNN